MKNSTNTNRLFTIAEVGDMLTPKVGEYRLFSFLRTNMGCLSKDNVPQEPWVSNGCLKQVDIRTYSKAGTRYSGYLQPRATLIGVQEIQKAVTDHLNNGGVI